MLAVLKANAYGHGALGVAEALAEDVQFFGVANLEEALALRQRVTQPIITLSPTLADERAAVVQHAIIPTISSFEEAEAFAKHGRALVNFKVDTGNGRMGVVEPQAVDVFKRVAALSNVQVHSVSTHMPVSTEDADYTRDQLVRFGKVVDRLRAEVPAEYKVHVLQSAGTLAFNERPYEIVRAGIVLYGISP